MNKIINYTVSKRNDDYTTKSITSRTNIEKNEHILDESNSYKCQVKNFKANVSLPIFTITPDDKIGMIMYGGDDTSITQTYIVLEDTPIYSVEDLVLLLGFAFIRLAGQNRIKNPSYTSPDYPVIIYNDEYGQYTLYIPTEFYSSPFITTFLFCNKLCDIFDFGYINFTSDETTIFNKSLSYIAFDATIKPVEMNQITSNYVLFANRRENDIPLTDIDSLVFVSNSVPVNGSIEHENKRVETQIIKQYKLSPQETVDGYVVYNHTMDDYYELISHYPLSRIEIELYARKNTGELIHIDLKQSESYSCDLEFVKI